MLNFNFEMHHDTGIKKEIFVFRVDLNAYPRLANVKYQKASMEAGDCLYIPYLWYIDCLRDSFYFLDSISFDNFFCNVKCFNSKF